MATYKLDPAAASTFGSVNLVGAQSFSIEFAADETVLGSDGKPFIQGAFYDNLSYTVSVEMSDAPKTDKVGDVATLTLKAKARVNGEGVDTGVLTFTSAASGAVCSGVTHTVNHAGNSSCTVSFRLVSADGTTDPCTVA
jgi:hypothetical protein